jgi:hypothetical protein
MSIQTGDVVRHRSGAGKRWKVLEILRNGLLRALGGAWTLAECARSRGRSTTGRSESRGARPHMGTAWACAPQGQHTDGKSIPARPTLAL